MADIFTKKKRSEVMAAIRSKGNKSTEQRFTAILRAHGIKGWRRHAKLPGSPDFVFPNQKVAIFVDGCFWHFCPWHGHKPISNRKFWQKKLGRNKARDRRVTKELRQKGWRVLRLWEHQLRDDMKIIVRTQRFIWHNTRKTIDIMGTKK